MGAWADGAWATGAWQGTAWQTAAPVEVPDVVGMTQAEAIAALELAGFTVVVAEASSSTVAVGDVISQEPAAGTEATEGSTVTITVSSGDTDPLDVKFSAKRPNVRMRRLAEIQPAAPLPAEITNMPDAPEPPAPVVAALARGLDVTLVEPPPPAPEPTAEVVQEAGPGLTPRNEGSTPSLGATLAPEAAPAAPPATQPDLEAETLRVAETVGKVVAGMAEAVSSTIGASLTGQLDGLVEVLRAVQTELSGIRADWAAARAADEKQRALERRNEQRRQEIADRLLKGD